MPHEVLLRVDSLRLHPLEETGFANRRAAHERLLEEGFFSAGNGRYKDRSGLCMAVLPVGDHIEVMVVERPASDADEAWFEDTVRFTVRPPHEVMESRPLRTIRRRRQRRRIWRKAVPPAPRPRITLREIGIAIGAVCSILGSGAVLGAILAHLITLAMSGNA